MASSAYYLEMANKFDALSKELSTLFGPIESCNTTVRANTSNMQNTIINGQPLDEGKLVDASGKLGTVSDNVNTMIAECAQKYAYYMQLYEAAKREEEYRAAGYTHWWQEE